MKKFVVVLAIIGIFAIYSVGIRHQSPVIAKPASLDTKSASSNASTNTGTSTAAATSSTPSTGSMAMGMASTGQYKNGTYTGSVADAYYGNVQVSVTISGGKITDVSFLDSPHTHSTSVVINQQAMPYLKQEAIQAQSSNVQIISGATYTSQAFNQSLSAALSQAQA